MRLALVRFAYTPAATLGYLYLEGSTRLCTLEEPWIPDPDGPGGQRLEPGVHESCVPDGLYRLVSHSGPRFQDVYKLINPALGVYADARPPGQSWGRAAILIHSGNVLANTEGCILVGLSHSFPEKVNDSRLALGKLREFLGPSAEREILIRPRAGTSEVL